MNEKNYPQFTVGRISDIIKNTLEQTFPIVSVIGEVSNFTKNKGYGFFSIKDDSAFLKCVSWNADKLSIQNGDLVIATGKITVYKNSSSYQLTVYNIELQGIGFLSKQFEILKQKLQNEGLFDASCKKFLPNFVQEIAVISAKGSAALSDILVNFEGNILQKTHLIYATMQGNDCAGSVIRAVKIAENLPVQAIIIARGGGSFEDLNAFNDEALARTVFACKIPIISAIGHEIDFTILDFVADIRAPTPTAAAKLVSPLKSDIIKQVLVLEKSCNQKIHFTIAQMKYKLDVFEKLIKNSLHYTLSRYKKNIENIEKKLSKNIFLNLLKKKLQKIELIESKIEVINPQNVLNKGFALLCKDNIFYDNPSKLNGKFSIITKNGKFLAKKLED